MKFNFYIVIAVAIIGAITGSLAVSLGEIEPAASAASPAAVRFKAQEAIAPSCTGCLFERSYGVCSAAAALATANDQPDCDDRSPAGMTYIYVLDKSDPRQMGLIKPLKQMESTS
ncbi:MULTISPECIES: hypothetical protein [unclassified Janthinobacterium]|uniref:hypothetical protein n=1 Tax=unclassified Janthinobacterium TaxID=2610881 RepID=UPI0018C9FBF8|nr:hypothetical protein [Janthinobacterium sp. CG_23.4]MDH6157401.1 hypothetical protein [Janthinobacterium sp. CG_23.4]